MVGAALGAVFLVIGLIRAAIVLVTGAKVQFAGFLIGAAWYVLGFASAGALVGLLWPLSRVRPLRYLLGIVAACCVVGAITISDDGAPWLWSHDTFIMWMGLSGAFGLAAGVGIDRGVRAA